MNIKWNHRVNELVFVNTGTGIIEYTIKCYVHRINCTSADTVRLVNIMTVKSE